MPQFNGNADFSGQLNQMLAPYQQVAQQVSSPYATMRPDSWLAQNHPRLAQGLDNAFLSGAMTPGPQGPEGVGGGISRVFQGLLGANQFHRQQQIENAMLPYKMAMGQLQAQDTASQIEERHYIGQYDRARSGLFDQRMMLGEQPHALPGGIRQSYDPATQSSTEWQMINDPMNPQRPVRAFNPITGKYADELPPEEQPNFTKPAPISHTLMNGGGGILGQLIVGANPKLPNETDTAYSQRLLPQYMKAMGQQAGQQAGQRASADATVTQPIQDRKAFIDHQTEAYKNIPPVPSLAEFMKAVPGAEYDSVAAAQARAQWQQMQTTNARQKSQRSIALAQWSRSTAPDQGVSVDEFLANPGAYAPDRGKAPFSTGAPQAVPAPNMGFNPLK